MIDKIAEALDGAVDGRTIGVLGLSFKPETDDMRDAPAVGIIRGLDKLGARVQAYDPQAMSEASRIIPNLVTCSDAYEACRGADALVLITEWNQFRMLDLARIKSLLRRPIIVDLRNVYEPAPMRKAGFEYICVGR
jgi:UDPglucose 6-dehydrogenase